MPPLGTDRGFGPTDLERAAFDPNPVPGAPFANPCPPGTPVREYNIVGIQKDLVYNEAGWHDPEGRLFVLAEDEADVLAGRKKPEPLFIRANVGECVDITFTNKLPETLGPSAFQVLTETPFCGIHIHFVKFDPMASDGANTGWNYFSGVERNKTIRYRWFVDTELKTVFFHDHMHALQHQHHGLFGALITEPRGSSCRHPRTGERQVHGAQLDVLNLFLPAVREMVLIMHDGVFLLNAEGKVIPEAFVIVPIDPEDLDPEDQGMKAFNYRSEPFANRLRAIPQVHKVFSSLFHGDPATPVFEVIIGDPVTIRLLMPSDKPRAHSLVIDGHNYLQQSEDLFSQAIAVRGAVTVGEGLSVKIAGAISPMGTPGDFMYRSGLIRWDVELGMWGLLRVEDKNKTSLLALPGR